ncbi:MAG TPA: hypothetical protein VF292_14105 [Rhodanobacteraceae bacterium]
MKQNYSFEKRQRELAKQKKKEAKAERKLARSKPTTGTPLCETSPVVETDP